MTDHPKPSAEALAAADEVALLGDRLAATRAAARPDAMLRRAARPFPEHRQPPEHLPAEIALGHTLIICRKWPTVRTDRLGWLRTMGLLTERGPITVTDGLYR